jgi:hypothetical protein
MEARNKDNLTDATEALQRHSNDSQPQGRDQQVIDNEGETITLGQNRPDKTVPPNKGNPLELSQGFIDQIIGVAKSALEKTLSKLGARNESQSSK